MTRPFASSGDLAPKKQTLEVLADGVYALTAEGDPNVGAIEGEDFVVCIEAMATPHAAEKWLALLRQHTDKPVRFLVLTHYHAVRTLGASAFDTDLVIAHENTRALINERGQQDWESELGRMPRLFDEPDSIPGLTRPSIGFTAELTIQLGGDRGELILAHCGLGHTEGDIVAWLPRSKILFAGDLVESQAALYTGDAYHRQWATTTLDHVTGFEPHILVGGRGPATYGPQAVNAAIAQTRDFLTTLIDHTTRVHDRGGSLAEAFHASREALAPRYSGWPIFDHCLPFDVSRLWDELDGVVRPRIWTAARDHEIWELLQG